jgi:hypothetical protein
VVDRFSLVSAAQRVGEPTMRKYWQKIAQWLNLPNAAQYTGHGMKRFAASAAVRNGLTGPEMQTQFAWRSAATKTAQATRPPGWCVGYD